MIRRSLFIPVIVAFLLIGASILALKDRMALAEARTIRAAGSASVGGDTITLESTVESDQRTGSSRDSKSPGLEPVPAPDHASRIDPVRGRLVNGDADPLKRGFQSKDKTSAGQDSIEISAEQIRDLMEGYLKRHMQWEPGRSRILEIQISHPVVLPKGRITASIREVGERESALPGRIPLSIAFRSDGAHEKTSWAIARIEVMGEAVFAKQSIKRRRPITEDDVELRKVDLGTCPANILVQLDEVIGSRASRSIAEDTALTADMVALPPIIQRRAVVIVIAEKGGLRMKTLGEVKEDGRVGDVVKVMNLESRKAIYARVVDAKTVKVEF